MCYSAQIKAEYLKYCRAFGADLDLTEFVQIYWERKTNPKVKIPKAVDAEFLGIDPLVARVGESNVRKLITEFNAVQVVETEQELFKQRKRLADAERVLQSKPTKKAADDQRISTDKIAKAMLKLSDLKRSDVKPRDARIFPGNYAPVMVVEAGQVLIKPMRYQCRPEGKPAFYDTKYPGTYNARRDNLQGFWKDLFGFHHGILVVERFYENVTGTDGKNQVLEFAPDNGEPMLVACLWSRWTGEDDDELLSFAAITSEPPPEVAAAGHDRCIVSIKPENVERWLRPDASTIAEQLAILDDPVRPYYEHRLAA